MDLNYLGMLRAALRQALRDLSEFMTQEKIDQVLDQIVVLTRLIEEIEKLN